VKATDTTESFNPSSGDDGKSAYSKLLAQRESEKQADLQKELSQEQHWWEQEVPYYKFTLVTLRDKLMEKAKASGDGISQSADYFQCIPEVFDPNGGDVNVAKIKFQNNTNWSFLVTITAKDIGNRRKLRISCSGGYLEIHADENNLGAEISVPSKNFSDDKVSAMGISKPLIVEGLTILIGAQEEFLSNTNR
jgi:hypothetical protein